MTEDTKDFETLEAKEAAAIAIYAFMGWLTSRQAESGIFSSHHEASEAARLADRFCKSQGWEINSENWTDNLTDYPDK